MKRNFHLFLDLGYMHWYEYLNLFYKPRRFLSENKCPVEAPTLRRKNLAPGHAISRIIVKTAALFHTFSKNVISAGFTPIREF
jgi:hypothetical protein